MEISDEDEFYATTGGLHTSPTPLIDPITHKCCQWPKSKPDFEGTDSHPPHPTHCGLFPGDGFQYNEPRFNAFYKVLIENPNTHHYVIVPFIKYCYELFSFYCTIQLMIRPAPKRPSLYSLDWGKF